MTDFERIFIDTAPFIYYLEQHPKYFHRMYNFFTISHEKGILLVTSALTAEEYCVSHYRNGTIDMVENLDQFIDYMNIKVIPIDTVVAKQGAKIRANYKYFKAMDALQIAAAIYSGCDAFLTNDKQLKQEKELPCITMDELEL